MMTKFAEAYIDGLVQERRNSSVLASAHRYMYRWVSACWIKQL